MIYGIFFKEYNIVCTYQKDIRPGIGGIRMEAMRVKMSTRKIKGKKKKED